MYVYRQRQLLGPYTRGWVKSQESRLSEYKALSYSESLSLLRKRQLISPLFMLNIIDSSLALY